ncbi:MAG: hypothetical protein GWN58_27580 [Anaerolineae bacterium]|nr:hypothetical protein [Anaerolineae bacterium]
MNETTPQARAAYITRILLLRRYHDAPGMTVSQVAKSLKMSYAGARRLLGNLSEHPELPVYRTQAGYYHARYEPHGLGPAPREYTPSQRASIVAQRMICRYLFEGEDYWTKEQMAVVAGLKPTSALKLLATISERGGVPAYYDPDSKKWRMEMSVFDENL